ncbi:hypothetical protein A7E78_12130 [Syntrophotalea acetylenivorans]|uniref:RDD domain-containing protein n=1 Tax=Syntrophotalea acetylenivorans TaxID=1842532 RepID=A0A1L3GRI7_9BACT|nr:RDD family protein [Syntrophotalea acetylenivorans]APG28523.1 hypothetical protein A7E78_12130 [Syntrophotalea acetylenivorans]
MKCPKCGYQSFNNLAACKKCGRDLTQEQLKLNLGNPVVPPLPVQPAEEPPPAAEEVPATPVPEPVAVKEQEIPEDEHVLEDFFQSIDSLDHDQIPAALPMDIPRPTNTGKDSKVKRKAATDVPQWIQESPQGDFPFEELDSDLDALRLTPSAEPESDDASPFDDVDDFEIDWQSPLDVEAVAKAEPAIVKESANEPQPLKKEENREEVPTIEEPITEQSKTVSIENFVELESIKAEVPPSPSTTEQRDKDKEWPLPELPKDHQSEKSFTLEESSEPLPPVEEVLEEAEASLPQPAEVQEELPLAAREIEAPAKQPNIAAIFLPDAERDPIASGAQLLTRRAKAYLTDLGLLTVIFALFICAGEFARSPGTGDRFQFTSDVLLDLATPYFLVFFALCFGYFTLFHYLSGQTPGKMFFDVRVEGDDHDSITLAQAFLRCVGGLISLLPAGLGFLSIVLNEEQRGWNDQLSNCQVVMLDESRED